MRILLSPQTEKLIEERMKDTGVSTPDDLVRIALQSLDQLHGERIEDLDPGTQAAIKRGLAQADQGEVRPWEDVREELRARFLTK